MIWAKDPFVLAYPSDTFSLGCGPRGPRIYRVRRVLVSDVSGVGYEDLYAILVVTPHADFDVDFFDEAKTWHLMTPNVRANRPAEASAVSPG